VLVLSSLASFMVILDMLVVATALRTIQKSLGASLADLEWTVTAYTLTFAVFLMTAAVLGSRFGRRRIFVGGLAVFGLASAACALAPSVGALIAARTVQGLGAAAIMPTSLALLNAAFPPERRGWATGVYGSLGALGVAVGPVLGGAVTQGLSWQWIFWVNVPVAVVAIPLVLARVPEGRGPAIRVDLPGLVLAGLACLGLVWGLIRGNDDGWGSATVAPALVGGALFAVAFVAWERRAAAPMLPLRLLRSSSFSAGSGVIFLLNGAITAGVFFTAQFFQVSQVEQPLPAGLRLLPWGIAPVLIAPRAGALADRFGERLLVVTGMALIAAGMGGLAFAGTGTPDLVLVVPIVLSGIGCGLAIPAVTKAVVSSVALADIGTASGVYSTARQLGGAFGVAVAGAVFATAGGYASPAQFADGYRPAMWLAAALACAGLLAALALRRRVPSHPAPTPTQPAPALADTR
jgi:EmrB/QacA subfamily drug resistance transporter